MNRHQHFSDDMVQDTEITRVQLTIETPKGKGKGKAIPLQAWTGPEGSRR